MVGSLAVAAEVGVVVARGIVVAVAHRRGQEAEPAVGDSPEEAEGSSELTPSISCIVLNGRKGKHKRHHFEKGQFASH